MEMNPSPLLSLEVGHFVWQDTAKEYVQRIYRVSRAFNFGRFAVFLLCFVVFKRFALQQGITNTLQEKRH